MVVGLDIYFAVLVGKHERQQLRDALSELRAHTAEQQKSLAGIQASIDAIRRDLVESRRHAIAIHRAAADELAAHGIELPAPNAEARDAEFADTQVGNVIVLLSLLTAVRELRKARLRSASDEDVDRVVDDLVAIGALDPEHRPAASSLLAHVPERATSNGNLLELAMRRA